MTLDTGWKQFIVNVRGSVRITTAKTRTDVQRQLAGHLGLVEAAFALIASSPSPEVFDADQREFKPVDTWQHAITITRTCIQNGATADQLNALVTATDTLFAAIVRHRYGSIQNDAISALGWLMRSVLCISAGITDRANECGRNTLDAVLRVVILTGHLRSDLTLLMREIGVSV